MISRSSLPNDSPAAPLDDTIFPYLLMTKLWTKAQITGERPANAAEERARVTQIRKIPSMKSEPTRSWADREESFERHFPCFPGLLQRACFNEFDVDFFHHNRQDLLDLSRPK